MTVDTMTINANSELELASSGYVLDLKDLFSSALHGDLIGDSLIVGGTLTPGTFSTVKYSSATSTDNVEITTATYNSLQFSGAETYELLGNLTVANALTGSSTIDTGATLDVTTSNLGITLAGNRDNNGTFTPRSGTVTFNAAAGTQTIDNGANDSFWHLTLSNAGIKQLNTNRLDVNGTFSLQGGTFDANGLNQLYAGSVSLSTNTVYTKGGILTFNHATGITYTDSNDTKQNIGTVRLLSAVATPPDNTLTLLSSMTVDTMTITFDNVLALGSSGYILNLAKDGATATVLTVDGTLTPGINSTVKYSALNSGGNINVASTTYDSLQFSGVDEVYVLIDHLTGSNALTGSSTIDTGATLDVTASNFGITLAGNWSNSGTSTPRWTTIPRCSISTTR